ncbi:MAG: hypothetical protein FD166_1848 [Bacteroidetes bacterium]|nr:MAG: hypothetical protein FD166_1848 [Bacteroidota bacterium]
MKKIILLFVSGILSAFAVYSQNARSQNEGVVSYVSSQNVYVKFSSTENISVGDTLYMILDGKNQPALRVNNLSSISCVCVPLLSRKFTTSDRIYTNNRPVIVGEETKPTPPDTKVQVSEPVNTPVTDTLPTAAAAKPVRKQLITGRVSAASYINLSDTPSGNSLRMRYNLTFNAKNIGNSRLSAESYISFAHKSKHWGEIQDNIFKGLKIYNLSLNYEIGKNARIYAGRKINPKISNMGAVDGIQFEIKTNSITTGVLAGSRPDNTDYGFNTSLFQYGAFVNHEHTYLRGNVQTTLAFIEQKNSGITDRRFTYIQHSNTLVKNLSFFGSAEFDLYRYNLKIDSSLLAADTLRVTNTAPKLSNLYLSLRYRFSGKLSLSLSYSSRQNIIYYETYKSFIDQLLEKETQQGFMMQVSYRPLKKLSLGANGGYRFRKSDPSPSKNLYAYATYSQIPFVGISATLTATILETSYLRGSIYGLGLSRDIVRGKLSGAFTYRFIDYFYTNTSSNLMQHTGEISLNWKLMKKLSCSFYYEGTFDSRYIFNRFYLQLTKSF